MHSFWWDKGVELELCDTGKYRHVKSTREAAECLHLHWPLQQGRALAAAKRACLQALEGKAAPEKACRAFIKAALEGDIYIHMQ